MYKEKIVNVTNGEVTWRDYTAAEIAQVEAAKKTALEKTAQAEQAATDKAALLAKMGITADEAKLLLS